LNLPKENEMIDIIDMLKEIDAQYSNIDTDESIELFTVAAKVISGIELTQILPGNETLTKEMSYLHNDIQNPKHILELYRLESSEIEDLLSDTFSFLIHITEHHINDEDMNERINRLKYILEERVRLISSTDDFDRNIVGTTLEVLNSLDINIERETIVEDFKNFLTARFLELTNSIDPYDIQNTYLAIYILGSRILNPSDVGAIGITTHMENLSDHIGATREHIPECILSTLSDNWLGLVRFIQLTHEEGGEVPEIIQRSIRASINILEVILEDEKDGESDEDGTDDDHETLQKLLNDLKSFTDSEE